MNHNQSVKSQNIYKSEVTGKCNMWQFVKLQNWCKRKEKVNNFTDLYAKVISSPLTKLFSRSADVCQCSTGTLMHAQILFLPDLCHSPQSNVAELKEMNWITGHNQNEIYFCDLHTHGICFGVRISFQCIETTTVMNIRNKFLCTSVLYTVQCTMEAGFCH